MLTKVLETRRGRVAVAAALASYIFVVLVLRDLAVAREWLRTPVEVMQWLGIFVPWGVFTSMAPSRAPATNDKGSGS